MKRTTSTQNTQALVFSSSVPRCVCGSTDSTQSSCDQTAEMFGRQVYLVSPHRFGAARIGAKSESRGSGHEPRDQRLMGRKSQCACRSRRKGSWCSLRGHPQQLDARQPRYDAESLRQDGRSCELYPHRVWRKDDWLVKKPRSLEIDETSVVKLTESKPPLFQHGCFYAPLFHRDTFGRGCGHMWRRFHSLV